MARRSPLSGISVVVPMKNEEATIETLLDGLAGQTLVPTEVILVDGGSTDHTVERIADWCARSPLGCRVACIREKEATPGRGRNVGAERAKYEWLAFTDAGIRLHARWLEHLAERAAASEVEVVYGSFEPEQSTFFESCAALAYVPPKRVREGRPSRGPSTASMLIHRDAWARVGGFPNLRAAEDLVFFERLEAAAVRTGWAPQAVVFWKLQPTLVRTFRRFTLYSRHNAWAGRHWDWHYGIARQYLLALPFWLAGAFVSAHWFLVPVLGLLGRALRGICKRLEGHSIGGALHPARVLTVCGILLVIDLATFVGWAQSVLPHPPSPAEGAQ